MTEEEIKNELADNERIAMKCVCDTLLNYEGRVRNYLADFVASLCNVEKEKMFSENNSLDVAQARWLFWYAYRYMTGETYEKIETFTKVGVASSVNKMSVMIEQQPIWKKRWTIVKRIIRITNSLIDENTEEPIKIIIPKNANVELKRE